MVSPNQKWSLQPVPPFLEWELYSKELSVSHLIVPFRWRKTMGKEGTGMQLAIFRRASEHDRSHPGVRGKELALATDREHP